MHGIRWYSRKIIMMAQKHNERYQELISNIPSIKFVQFVERPKWIADVLLTGEQIAEEIDIISRKKYSEVEQVRWMIDILSKKNIEGDFLLSFDTLPFAHVSLDASYDWVKPLWQIGHLLDFMPLDESYLLYVQWTESCIGGGNDCIVAEIAMKPEK